MNDGEGSGSDGIGDDASPPPLGDDGERTPARARRTERPGGSAPSPGRRTESDGATDACRRSPRLLTDGGVDGRDESVEYLEAEVNIFRPSTPFMRDHLRVIWTGFLVWAVVVFGPVTATAIAPGPMTTQLPVLGFPLHYFLVGIGAPGGALVLAIWYARKRDQLDEKYGVEHGTAAGDPGSGGGEATATDGGDPAGPVDDVPGGQSAGAGSDGPVGETTDRERSDETTDGGRSE